MHLCQRCLCLWEPESHVHGVVQCDGGGQRRTGLFPLTRGGIQNAETTLTVGHEWAHAEGVGLGLGLAVVGGGLYHVWGCASHHNRAEQVQSIGLVAMVLMLYGERQRLLNEGMCLRQGARQHLRLAKMQTTEHLKVDSACGHSLG